MRMIKAFNVIVKIFKGYLILNTLCLAFIGVGEELDEFRKHPEESVVNNNGKVFDHAVTKIKKFYKGEA